MGQQLSAVTPAPSTSAVPEAMSQTAGPSQTGRLYHDPKPRKTAVVSAQAKGKQAQTPDQSTISARAIQSHYLPPLQPRPSHPGPRNLHTAFSDAMPMRSSPPHRPNAGSSSLTPTVANTSSSFEYGNLPDNNHTEVEVDTRETRSRIQQKARQQFLMNFNSTSWEVPIKLVVPDIQVGCEAYNAFKKGVLMDMKTWKHQILEGARGVFVDWYMEGNQFEATQIAEDYKTALIDIKCRLSQAYSAIKWYPQIFPFAYKWICLDDISPLGKKWVRCKF